MKSIKEKLLETLKAIINPNISYSERLKYIIQVSKEDSLSVEDALDKGEFGETLRSEYLKKGLIAAYPLFFGHIVVWYAPKTECKHFKDLSKDELMFVIDNQKKQISQLHEFRQRL